MKHALSSTSYDVGFVAYAVLESLVDRYLSGGSSICHTDIVLHPRKVLATTDHKLEPLDRQLYPWSEQSYDESSCIAIVPLGRCPYFVSNTIQCLSDFGPQVVQHLMD